AEVLPAGFSQALASRSSVARARPSAPLPWCWQAVRLAELQAAWLPTPWMTNSRSAPSGKYFDPRRAHPVMVGAVGCLRGQQGRLPCHRPSVGRIRPCRDKGGLLRGSGTSLLFEPASTYPTNMDGVRQRLARRDHRRQPASSPILDVSPHARPSPRSLSA